MVYTLVRLEADCGTGAHGSSLGSSGAACAVVAAEVLTGDIGDLLPQKI